MDTSRPFTTLFVLVSVDGKISTGDRKEMDFDLDFPHIRGVKDGLNQYYDLELGTDEFSLNTGKTLARSESTRSKTAQNSRQSPLWWWTLGPISPGKEFRISSKGDESS